MPGPIATVFVDVRANTRPFNADLARSLRGQATGEKAGREVGAGVTSGMGRSLAGVGGILAGAFAGARVGTFLKDATTQASDLSETVNKSKVIFGDNAEEIRAWAETSARSFGLSQAQALGATAQFGDMFQQLGFTGDAASKASTNLVQTAADLGSFNNVDPSDVLDRIGASLRGEYDSLQQLIPNINAARVQQEALAATGKTSVKELTAQEKATATLAIIQKDGAAAAGDFAKTSGGLANQQRILTAQWDDAKATLGKALLPALTSLATVANDKVVPAIADIAERHGPKLAKFFEEAAPKIEALFDGDAAGGGEMAVSLGKLGDAAADLGPALKDASGSLPSLTDALDVGAVAIGFFADNADLLAKSMPYLVGALVAYKAAQLAANVAQVVAVPMRVLEIVVNRQLVNSNKALIASRKSMTAAVITSTAAETGSTAAKTGGILATVRSTVTTAARRTVELATAAASKAMAAAQWLVNAALAANPIGLVIVGLVALGAGLVLAYKKSETFRNIVQGAWRGIQTAADFAWNRVLKPALAALGRGLEQAWADAQTFGRIIGQVWGAVRGAFEFAWNRVIKPILGFYADNLARAWGTMQTFGRVIGNVWSDIRSLFIGGVRTIVNTWLTGVERILQIGGKLPGGLGKQFREAEGKVKGFREGFNREMDALRDQNVDINVRAFADAQRDAGIVIRGPGNKPMRLAVGGQVRGPGGPRDDVIPAMLSNGEFVVNAKATAKHLPLLREINSHKPVLKAGTTLPKLADGGLVLRQVLPKPTSISRQVASDVDDITRTVAKRLAARLSVEQTAGYDFPHTGSDYARVRVQGKQFNTRTAKMLEAADRIFAGTWRIAQGSYSTSVAASGGTHSGGGAVDLSPSNGDWSGAVRALRSIGFAAWHRTPSQGPWGHHIHGIAIGDASASSSAKGQVRDFLRGGDGLAGRRDGGLIGTVVRDSGGIVRHGEAALNLSGRNERVLSPRQSDSFDRLVTVLERGGTTNVGAPNVHVYVDGQEFRGLVRVEVDEAHGRIADGLTYGRR